MAPTQGAVLLRQIRKLVAARCPSQQSDLQLLQEFISEGSESAFAALVERHGAMVLGVCRNVLQQQQDAEDVFQAAFLVLARKAPTIRKQQSVSSWLHGVAYRLALKARGRVQRRQGREQPLGEAFAAGADLTLRELRLILHEELQRLPEKYRAPLLLCYWEGLTRDEAAARLGASAGVFKKQLERARNLLRSRLVGRGLVPSVAFFSALFSDMAARAAVPTLLAHSTAKAALAYAAGQGTGVPTAAALLAEGVLRAMTMNQWLTKVVPVVLLSCLGAGLGLVSYQALHGQQADAPPSALAAAGQKEPQGNKAPAAKTDKERILGTWRFSVARVEGKDLPAELTMLMRLTFTRDGKAAMTMGEESKEGKYKFAGPGQMDLGLGGSQEYGPSIYKFEGDDRFTICAWQGPGEGKRPTEFTGEQGTGQLLMVLDRVKPGDPKPSPQEAAKLKEAVEKVREAAARSASANSLKQIGITMHNYHDTNQALPLHAIYSQDGKTPLLSWRVALLPFYGDAALFQQFKLEEPWDSAHNKKLIAKMPGFYAHPERLGAPPASTGMTYYQVFTGPGTLFDGTKKMKFLDIKDGTSKTLLVIEAKNAVPWTKPDDLHFPREEGKMPAIGGLFKDGINALLCDVTVRFLPRDPQPALLRALVTPSGGEKVEIPD